MPNCAVSPQLRASGGLEGHRGSITALVFARKGGIDWLLSGSEDGKARLWDLERRKSVRCFLPPAGADGAEVASVCHGQDEVSDLVAMSYNTTVAVFDTRDPAIVSRKAAMSFSLHQDEVNDIAISCIDGRVHLAAADDNGEVVIYDLKAGKLLRRLSQCHDNICASVSFRSGHAWQLVSGGLDGKIVHWNYNKIRAVTTFHTANSPAKNGQLVNPRYPYSVACDSSGQRLAAALGDGSLAVYDLQSKKLVREWEVCDNMVNAVEWAPFAEAERPVLLSGGTDGYVAITDVTGVGPSSLCLVGLKDALLSLDPNTSGEHGEEQAQAARSDASCLLKLMCSSQINALACSPDGLVYVGDQGNSILEFDIRNPSSFCTDSRTLVAAQVAQCESGPDQTQAAMSCD